MTTPSDEAIERTLSLVDALQALFPYSGPTSTLRDDPSIRPEFGPKRSSAKLLHTWGIEGASPDVLAAFEKGRERLRAVGNDYFHRLLRETLSTEANDGMSDCHQQTILARSVGQWYQQQELEYVATVKCTEPSAAHKANMSPAKLTVLEKAYGINDHPNTAEREKLARHVGLRSNQVTFWFQNRRHRSSPRQAAQPQSQDQASAKKSCDDPLMRTSGRRVSISSLGERRASFPVDTRSNNRDSDVGETATATLHRKDAPDSAQNAFADANPVDARRAFDGMPLSSLGTMEIIHLADGSIAYRPSRQPSYSGSTSSIPSSSTSFGTSASTAPSPDSANALPPTPTDGLSLFWTAKEAARKAAESAVISTSAARTCAADLSQINGKQKQLVELGVGVDGDGNGRRAVKAMPKRKKGGSGSGSAIISGQASSSTSATASGAPRTGSRTPGKTIVTYSMDDFAVPYVPPQLAQPGLNGRTISTAFLRAPSSGQQVSQDTPEPVYFTPSQLASASFTPPSSSDPQASSSISQQVLTTSTSASSLLSIASNRSGVGNERVPSLTRSCSVGSAMSVGGVLGEMMEAGSHARVASNGSNGNGGLSEMIGMRYTKSPAIFDGPTIDTSPTLHSNAPTFSHHLPIFNFDLPTPANTFTFDHSTDLFPLPHDENDLGCAYEFEGLGYALPFTELGFEEELKGIMMGEVREAVLDAVEDGSEEMVVPVADDVTKKEAEENIVQLPLTSDPASDHQLPIETPSTNQFTGLQGWDYSAPYDGSAEMAEGLEDELWRLLDAEDFEGIDNLLQAPSDEDALLVVGERADREQTIGTSSLRDEPLPNQAPTTEYLSFDMSSFLTQPAQSTLSAQVLQPAIETYEIPQLTLEQLQASGWMSEFDQAMPFSQQGWGTAMLGGSQGQEQEIMAQQGMQSIEGQVATGSGGMMGWTG